MQCPKCGCRTRVRETRHPDHATKLKYSSVAGKAEEAVSWYTVDWVARMRHCTNEVCGAKIGTIEISLEDLERGWQRRDSNSWQVENTPADE